MHERAKNPAPRSSTGFYEYAAGYVLVDQLIKAENQRVSG